MPYRVRISEADASPGELRAAEQRFREALEAVLGDASLVLPVYAAYRRILQTYGEEPSPDVLSEGERLVLEQWRVAETAAVTAAFGPNRYMGDADYEIEA